MSVSGPTSPSALLVQRLEAALGTSLSQANVQSGVRPDAVAQPGQSDRQHATQNDAQRTGQERVDRHRVQTDHTGRRDVSDARSMRQGVLAGSEPQTGATSSAPTRLGQAARLILALLMHMPERAPAAVGRQPLLPNAPLPGTGAGEGASGATGAAVSGASARGAASQPPGAVAMPTGEAEADQEAPGAQRLRAGGGTAEATSRGGDTAAGAPRGAEGAARTQSLQALVQQGLMAGQLARSLGNAVQTSGLFYESHLQDWVFGSRSREQIMQEPQAMLAGRVGAGQTGAATAPSPAAPGPAAQPAPAAPGMAAAAPAPPPVAAPAAPPPALPLQLPGIDSQVQGLVRQQLEVLANQTFHWRGEVWPGAPLDWEIRRREGQPPPSGGQGIDEPDHWSTTLRLQLGRLGDVYARLGMSGGEVVLHLAAPDAAPALQAALHGLRERFQGHALSLVQVSISDQWPADREAVSA